MTLLPWEWALGGLALLGVGAGALGAAGVLAAPVGFGVAGIAMLGGTAAVATASARPGLQIFGPALCRGTHPGRLAVTIDDGPDPRSTPALLAALADAGATATFFVLADKVDAHPELFAAIRDAGHEVGLHGLTHDPLLAFRSPARGAAHLERGLARLAAHGAAEVRWFRPPFGVVSPRVYAALERLPKLTLAWCSVRTGDGAWISASALRARCAAAVGTDIVLLHDGGGHAPALLPELLAEWRSRGIQPTSLGAAMEAP